jgi:hypothetical protein
MTTTSTPNLSDFGTFEGFNFRDQSAIEQTLTAEEVVDWDHDAAGEAEFWPAGDAPLVRGIFPGNVTGPDLLTLGELLDQMDGDREQDLMRVQFALQVLGHRLDSLTSQEMEDVQPMFFYGDTTIDARKEAAFELFETFWPELYKAWNEDHAGILKFDWDDFIDSPLWTVHGVDLGGRIVLMVNPN